MSTLRVSNIEVKADASSPSVNEKLKVTNSNGDVLIHVNGETSGVTTVGINTTGSSFDIDSNQNVTFAGIVTANQITVGDTFLKPQSVGLGTTSTAGRNAGVSTAIGTLIYNASVNQIQAYGPVGWINVKSIHPEGLTATGGIIKDYDDGINKYRSHTFVSSGTFQVTELSNDFDNVIDYMVVAGGGAGGDDGPAGNCAGGGGAGGLYYSTAFNVSTQSYTVVVGAGGAMSSDPADGNGGPSTFGTVTMNGGGAGAAQNSNLGAQNGGSGGGAAYSTAGTNLGGTGSGNSNGTDGAVSPPIGFGNVGGAFGGQPSAAAAGGGGAGGIGESVNYPAPGYSKGSGNLSGAGGVGLQYSIDGTSTYYAGGGGGHGYAQISSGGDGGGGSAHPTVVAARGDARGVRNTGGGGGGCSHPATPAGGGGRPGSGGSGVVIVRYKIGDSQTATAKATGGLISFYNGKTIHTFTATGSFITPASFSETVEYVVVGGGGAGGWGGGNGGGGGAGAYRTGTTPLSGPQTLTVQVGSGGARTTAKTSAGFQGTPSYFGTPITSPGGGGGGSDDVNSTKNGAPGGSGGGGGGGGVTNANNTGATGTGDTFPGTIGATPANGWGNDGGTGGQGSSGDNGGGGGGGAGGVGGNNGPGQPGGTGGVGMQVPATFRDPKSTVGAPGPTTAYTNGDTSGKYWFAGGGGGASGSSGTQGVGGGSGGPYGGAGSGNNPSGNVALENTGSGGGGSTAGYAGGSGGSGIILIAYPT